LSINNFLTQQESSYQLTTFHYVLEKKSDDKINLKYFYEKKISQCSTFSVIMTAVSEETRNLNFIENYLVKIILQHNEEIKDCEVISVKAASSSQFDGFMSSLYFLDLKLKHHVSSSR
jgi:hypothetical protein